MKKIVRLTESDLVRLVKRVINEQNIVVSDPDIKYVANRPNTSAIKHSPNPQIVNGIVDLFYPTDLTKKVADGRDFGTWGDYIAANYSLTPRGNDYLTNINPNVPTGRMFKFTNDMHGYPRGTIVRVTPSSGTRKQSNPSFDF
jgi:hypothetical protein